MFFEPLLTAAHPFGAASALERGLRRADSALAGGEQDYCNVICFLVTEHRLSTESDYPNGDAYPRQATQPPIYFLIGTPVVALMDNVEPVVHGHGQRRWYADCLVTAGFPQAERVYGPDLR